MGRTAAQSRAYVARQKAADPAGWARRRAIHSLRQYRTNPARNSSLTRERRNEVTNAWNRRHPEARRAYRAVARALAAGELVRPETCERCAKPCKPYASQKGDHSRPLDVEWLCRRCDRFEKSKHHLTDADLGIGGTR